MLVTPLSYAPLAVFFIMIRHVSSLMVAIAFALAMLAVSDARMIMPERRDGSTITVETTQFNPAQTNQGGTTNLAGTFNVSPLATSTSYAFQTVQQTSTFAVNGAAPTAASSGNSGSSNNSGSSGGSDGSANSDGVVVVTSTADTTMTVGQPTTTAQQASASAATNNNNNGGLPTLALGTSQNAAFATSSSNYHIVAAAIACVFSTSVLASCLVL